MKLESREIFKKLKKEVSKTFLQDNTAHNEDISLWKGQEILDFQEDLFEKTKNSISEKWFYNYFKNEITKLPRIDMLNILSLYSGYKNWADFKQTNTPKITTETPQKKNSNWWILILAIGVILIASLIFILIPKENTFQFCFIDDNTNQHIETPIEIIVLRKGESPYYTSTEKNGCFAWKTSQKYIKAIIKSPYHKTDTIYRHINTKGKESIKLVTDDYALMIHYYSNSNIKDWKKRRQHLRNIIDTKAIIYQVFDGNIGIELYSKNDFINKLTLPTKSLKNIDIIETKYANNKIISLKFKQHLNK